MPCWPLGAAIAGPTHSNDGRARITYRRSPAGLQVAIRSRASRQHVSEIASAGTVWCSGIDCAEDDAVASSDLDLCATNPSLASAPVREPKENPVCVVRNARRQLAANEIHGCRRNALQVGAKKSCVRQPPLTLHLDDARAFTLKTLCSYFETSRDGFPNERFRGKDPHKGHESTRAFHNAFDPHGIAVGGDREVGCTDAGHQPIFDGSLTGKW